MQSLPNPLLSSALARPDAMALQCGQMSLTYAQLGRAARQRATVLSAHVRPADRVALWGPPSIDWVISFHALGWLGAAVAPLPARVPLTEVRTALEASGATHLLCTAGAEAAAALATQCVRVLPEMPDTAETAETQATNRPPKAPDTADTWEQTATAKTAGTVETAQATAPAIELSEMPERPWPLDETRWVLLTSGSTAAPRPICLTTGQLVFAAMGSSLRLGHLPKDRWLLCLPLNHVGGLSILQRAALCGTGVELMPRWDAAQAARRLCDGSVNLVSFVPAMLDQALRALQGPVSPALRAVVVGGAAATQELLERARGAGVPVCVSWGMTETGAQACTTFPNAWQAAGHAGSPLAFTRVSATPQGLLHVEGAQVQSPLATRDRGHVDRDGHVWVHGRADDVIISGGENIAPEEVEAVLLAHPSVGDAAVAPQADARWGQRPVAVLVLVAGAERPNDAAMRAWCAERLARFKVPEQFLWRTKLPRNAMGKLNRRSLLGLPAEDAPERAADAPQESS